MADPYLLPGGRTLRNKLGVSAPEVLARKEAAFVASRAIELSIKGLPPAHGFELFKAVHRHLFQDVYEWAGKVRTVNLSKETTNFTPWYLIEREGQKLFQDLSADSHLRDQPVEKFAKSLATYFGRLNQLHPFREGNGRAQRIVLELVGKEAGHPFSFLGISRERMIVVSIAASGGNPEPACRMFSELLNPIRAHALRVATEFLDKHRSSGIDWQQRYVATAEPDREYRGTFVSQGGPHFMMHDGRGILIGQMVDLSGQEPQSGGGVLFQASPWDADQGRAQSDIAPQAEPDSGIIAADEEQDPGR